MVQGSENDDISIFSLLSAKKLTSQGGYTGKVYHCKNCDYMGALIVEADEEMARAIREDYEQSRQNRRSD
jgi:hypothetical protein